MAAVTLTTLRVRVREIADMGSTTFVTDAATSLDAWINLGVQHLHSLLREVMKDEAHASSTAAISITVAAGTGVQALPADFDDLLGVDLSLGGQQVDARRFTFKERNALRAGGAWLPQVGPQYRLDGANLRLNGPDGTYTGSLLYVPTPALLVGGSDAVNYPNGYEEFAVLTAAIRCLLKEESDASGLMQLLGIERARIEAAGKRDEGSPPRAVDVEAAFTDGAPPWEF